VAAPPHPFPRTSRTIRSSASRKRERSFFVNAGPPPWAAPVAWARQDGPGKMSRGRPSFGGPYDPIVKRTTIWNRTAPGAPFFAFHTVAVTLRSPGGR
jgi:hypothetical protein